MLVSITRIQTQPLNAKTIPGRFKGGNPLPSNVIDESGMRNSRQWAEVWSGDTLKALVPEG